MSTCSLDPHGPSGPGPVRVLIVGGGVGALEGMLALHDLAAGRVEVTILSPAPEFRYRPASVAVPFGRGRVERFALSEVAAAAGAHLVQGSLERVDATAHVAFTGAGAQISYDVLVVACGARRMPVLQGALAFRGEEDADALRDLLGELERGTVRRVVFALPRGAAWALPLYELALLTAAHVADKRLTGVSLELVTPEVQPLAQFGDEASAAVSKLLAGRHIGVHLSTYPVRVYPNRLMLAPARTLAVDRVVCMPEARGVAIPGLPHNPDGFLPTDQHGRVTGIPDVYAVGDITTYPIKQGGIAAQQADHVAHLIAKHAGARIDDPEPLRPELHGLLLTGGAPIPLRSGGGDAAAAPGGKIAARHLGAYLEHARPLEQ